jgi:hypothetical protein
LRLALRRIVALGLVLGVLRALPAGAAELELGVTTGFIYDDSSASTVQNDGIANIGPRVRILDESGSLTWDVHYWATYEKYLDLGEADDWDHDFYAKAAWYPSPRTTVRLVERYLDSSNLNAAFIAQGGPDPSVDPVLQVGSNRIAFNQFTLSLEHLLTARQDVSLSFARYDTDYGEQTSDTEVMSLGGAYRYALTPVDRVGLALSAVQQEGSLGEVNRFYNGSLQWIHRFSPTLLLDASAGPTWVDQPEPDFPEVLPGRARYPAFRTGLGAAPIRASTCPSAGGGLHILRASCEPFGPGSFQSIDDLAFLLESVDLQRIGAEPSTDPTITYFAAIDLTKEWRDFAVTLSYTRDASTTSQIGGQVRDTLAINVNWSPPARPWRVNFWGSYGRREIPGARTAIEELVQPSTVSGVSDVAEAVGFRFIEVERSQQVDVYLAGLYASYSVTPRTQVYLNVTWEREQLDAELLSRRFDRLRVAVGVIYTLPRINLPF